MYSLGHYFSTVSFVQSPPFRYSLQACSSKFQSLWASQSAPVTGAVIVLYITCMRASQPFSVSVRAAAYPFAISTVQGENAGHADVTKRPVSLQIRVSVVAPIRMTKPSSPYGKKYVLLAFIEAVCPFINKKDVGPLPIHLWHPWLPV